MATAELDPFDRIVKCFGKPNRNLYRESLHIITFECSWLYGWDMKDKEDIILSQIAQVFHSVKANAQGEIWFHAIRHMDINQHKDIIAVYMLFSDVNDAVAFKLSSTETFPRTIPV